MSLGRYKAGAPSILFSSTRAKFTAPEYWHPPPAS